MVRDVIWNLVFSAAIAVLMLAILLIRSDPVSTWVLVIYPFTGALLAHVASRTSPTVEGIAWIETGTIAAACIVVLAALVNLLLLDVLMREIATGEFLSGANFKRFSFVALPTISVLLWWALHRRLSRLRRRGLAAQALRQEARARKETAEKPDQGVVDPEPVPEALGVNATVEPKHQRAL